MDEWPRMETGWQPKPKCGKKLIHYQFLTIMRTKSKCWETTSRLVAPFQMLAHWGLYIIFYIAWASIARPPWTYKLRSYQRRPDFPMGELKCKDRWQYRLWKLLHFMYSNKLIYLLSWYLNSTVSNPESWFRSVEAPREALQQFTVFSRFTTSESHPESSPWIASESSTLNTTIVYLHHKLHG